MYNSEIPLTAEQRCDLIEHASKSMLDKIDLLNKKVDHLKERYNKIEGNMSNLVVILRANTGLHDDDALKAIFNDLI